MKVVSGVLVREESNVVYVLLGNGSRDRRVLEAIASKLDHDIVMKEPTMPRNLGLDGVVRALRTCLERTRVRVYLLVLDIEHLKVYGERCVEEVIREAFSRYGLGIDVEKLSDYVYKLELALGHRRALAYLAINGLESNGLEENLAKLIEVRLGEKVSPDKVYRVLRDLGKRDIDIVAEASMEELASAFPGLVNALKALRRLLKQPS